MHGKKLGRW